MGTVEFKGWLRWCGGVQSRNHIKSSYSYGWFRLCWREVFFFDNMFSTAYIFRMKARPEMQEVSILVFRISDISERNSGNFLTISTNLCLFGLEGIMFIYDNVQIKITKNMNMFTFMLQILRKYVICTSCSWKPGKF